MCAPKSFQYVMRKKWNFLQNDVKTQIVMLMNSPLWSAAAEKRWGTTSSSLSPWQALNTEPALHV